MADKKTIGARIAMEGEQEFRQAIRNCNSAMSSMNSELDLVTAQYAKNANSLEALQKKQNVYIKLQDEQRKKISTLQEFQKKALKKYEEEKEKLEELKKVRDEDNKKLEEAKKEYGENSEQVKELSKILKESTKNYENQDKALNSLNNRINGYEKDINNASIQLLKLDDETEKNQKYLNEAKSSFDHCATSIDKYGKEIQEGREETKRFANEVAESTTKTGDFDHTVSKLVTANLVTEGIKKAASGIKMLATGSIDVGKSFESSMSTVSATMNIATNDIKNGTGAYMVLEDAARECGATTKYSATEAADALNYLALAGYDTDKAAQALPTVLNLAAAGAMDLAYASDLVTDSMSALEISTDGLTSFTDQLAVTSQKSNTNISQLGEAILTIGGTAKQLAGGTVELNTELGILADNGIKGAEGGTALRNILKNLTAPTDKAAAVMEKYNLQVYDLNGSIRPLNETFKDLGNILDEMSDQERNQVLNQIFDARNLKSAEALIANCGARFDELSGYISDCDGAARNMAVTMSDNLEGNTRELGSTLEELGISIYTKFDQPLKMSVKTATKGVTELNAEMSGGKLGKSVDNLATSFENLSGTLIELGIDALPTMINAVSWIVDNGSTIISVIVGVTAAKKAYTVALTAAQIAQEAFNITADLNPYVMLTTVALGAAAAIASFSLTTKDNTSIVSENVEELNKCTESIKQSRQSVDGLKEETRIQSEYVRSLKDELIQLNEAQTGDENEKRRIQEIVSLLNQQLPDLNLCINEQTGYIDQNSTAISQNIDNLLAWYSVQAMEEKMTEIYQETADSSYELWKTQKELEDIETKLNTVSVERTALEEKYTEAAKDGSDATREYSDELLELYNKEYDLKECQTQLKESIDGYEKETKEAGEEIQNLQEYIDEQKESMDSGTLSAYENAKAQKEVGDAAAKSAGEVSQVASAVSEEYTKMYEELSETIEKQLNLFEEFSAGTEVSKEKLLDNMQSQVDGINSWADNLESLSTRTDVAVNQGFLKYLAELGPSSANYVKAFAEMSTEELQKAMNSFGEAAVLPSEVTSKIMESYENIGKSSSDAVKTGLEASEEDVRMQTERITGKVEEGYTTGLEKAQDGIKSQTKRVVQEGIIKTSEKTLEIHSPSRVTKRQGENVGAGYIEGIKAKQGAVKMQTSQITKSIVDTSKTALSLKVFSDIGRNIPVGLATGILAEKSQVIEAAKAVAQSVIDTTNSTLDMHSPSRKMKTAGQNAGLGFLVGWKGVSSEIAGIVQETMKLSGSVDNIEIAASQKVNTTIIDESSIMKLAGVIKSEVANQLSNLNIIVNANADSQKMFDINVELNREYKNRHGVSAYV